MSALNKFIENSKHSIYYDDAIAELAQLRAAHDEMEGIIGELKFNDSKLRADLAAAQTRMEEAEQLILEAAGYVNGKSENLYKRLDAWLEKYPAVSRCLFGLRANMSDRKTR